MWTLRVGRLRRTRRRGVVEATNLHADAPDDRAARPVTSIGGVLTAMRRADTSGWDKGRSARSRCEVPLRESTGEVDARVETRGRLARSNRRRRSTGSIREIARGRLPPYARSSRLADTRADAGRRSNDITSHGRSPPLREAAAHRCSNPADKKKPRFRGAHGDARGVAVLVLSRGSSTDQRFGARVPTTSISTRRFFARPAGLSLPLTVFGAIGWLLPLPSV